MLDDIQVSSPAEMQAMLNTYIPGNTLRLKIWRGFDSLEKNIMLAEFPKLYGLEYGRKVFGLKVADYRQAATVKEVVADSPAARVGILPGDIIYEVGGHQTADVQQFSEVIVAHIGFEPQRFTIVRNKKGYFVDLP